MQSISIINAKPNSKTLSFSIVLLFSFNFFFGQNTLSISYNDKIDLGKVQSTTKFAISGPANAHLNGEQINDYVFATPGEYHIKVTEKKAAKKADSCDERHLPTDITVIVSRIKMTYDAKTMSFSAPVHKNTDTNGIVLSVAAKIETFDHLPAALNFTKVNTAGIGTSITSQLDQQLQQLSEGLHTLHYALSGTVTENSYLMFDFMDPNGNIQSVSLTTPINN